MISKSDLLIVVVAASALGVGVYRWHENTSNVSAITVPASSRAVESTDPASRPVDPTVIAAKTSAQPANTTVVVEPIEVKTIAAGAGNAGTNQAAVVTVTADEPQFGNYRIVSGDSLSKLAIRFDTSVATLQQLNNINGSIIRVGEQLRYPLAQ